MHRTDIDIELNRFKWIPERRVIYLPHTAPTQLLLSKDLHMEMRQKPSTPDRDDHCQTDGVALVSMVSWTEASVSLKVELYV